MTERQQRFVDAYIATGNASAAARQAGYSERGINVTASKLLAKTNILSEIENRLAEVRSQRIATAEEILQLATAIMRGQITESTALTVGVGKTARIEVVEMPPKMKDRLRAAEFLHKILSASKVEDRELEIRIVCAGKNQN